MAQPKTLEEYLLNAQVDLTKHESSLFEDRDKIEKAAPVRKSTDGQEKTDDPEEKGFKGFRFI